jgi:hypothetical protein
VDWSKFDQGATGFLISKTSGGYLMATNWHFLKSMDFQCFALPSLMGLDRKRMKCNKIIGHWKELDFALIEVVPDTIPGNTFTEAELKELESHFVPLRAKNLEKEDALFTIGRGSLYNPRGELRVDSSSDCKIWDGAVHKLDFSNFGMDYSVPLVPTGCESSPGDSGSPAFSADGKEIVGIFCCGTDPEIEMNLNFTRLEIDNLISHYDKSDKSIGSWFVPFSVIKSHLEKEIQRNDFEFNLRDVEEFLAKIH